MQTPSQVLVVDDADTVIHVLKYSLSRAGYGVKAANNGEQAIVLARQHRFDAVFTDIHMPGMDGIELIRVLRKLPGYEHIPILALTMTNTDVIKNTGRQAGATGWITKPVSPPRLLELLENFGLTAVPHPA